MDDDQRTRSRPRAGARAASPRAVQSGDIPVRPGRRRRYDATIPAHIDQARIPVGMYWDKRTSVWYTLITDAAGKRRRQNQLKADARLSDLFARMDALAGSAQGTFAAVLDAFHDSAQFRDLAATTRRGYEQCRRWIIATKTAAGPMGDLDVDSMPRAAIQTWIDRVATKTPTKANAMLRYLRRVLVWGQNRGHCRTNPAQGIEQATERKHVRMPDRALMNAVIDFARDRGARPAYSRGSCAAYLWIVMDLAYLCRMRSIEVLDLTLASETARGIKIERRKGSRDNETLWNPRLRQAWDAALELRQRALTRRDKDTVVQIKPAQRRLILSDDGTPLTIEGLRSAWDRFIKLAIREGVLPADQRFSLHSLKHRGITDTERAEKRTGGGHVTDTIAARYDHELPLVRPAGD